MNRLGLGFCLCISSLVCAVPDLYAADAPQETTVPGIAIGAQAPDFVLKDQHGNVRMLAEFIKPGKTVALVFYRSADW